MEKLIDLSDEKLYKPIVSKELNTHIENLIREKNDSELNSIMDRLIEFVNENRECYWKLVSISQFLYELRNKIECEVEDNLTPQVNLDFIEQFCNDLFNKLMTEISFNPEIEFMTYFNPERKSEEYWRSNTDWLWSNEQGGDEMTFTELIFNRAGLDINDIDYDSDKYVHFGISSLWIALRNYASDFPDAEDMAICLWTVFDNAHEICNDGSGVNWDIIQRIIEDLLYINMDDYNTEESDNLDLEAYDPYVHDFIKISQEILDRDIFDMDPWRWGEEYSK